MTRHKMSIDVGYVKDWGVQEGLRELFQNAIDHGSWSYSFDGDNTLRIASHNVTLPCSTLLLGHSKKAEGSIGKFGEGYKLACLVLARAGKTCCVSTGTELWQAKLINSRTYKTRQLVFDTEKHSGPAWSDTTFIVKGLTDEEISDLKKQNLHFGYPDILCESDKGKAIARPGDIFIHGLFVCHIDGYRHGYDFEPSVISVDRDRRMVRDFDLKWLTSQIWKNSDMYDEVIDMIKAQAEDVGYLDSMVYSTEQALADKAAEAFISEHGQEAIAVTTQQQLDTAREDGHEKIVIVPKVQHALMGISRLYVAPPPKVIKKTPREELLLFERAYGDNMCGAMASAFEALIELSKSWRC